MNSRYLNTTEIAKIIRKELKENFPGIKFSVRSSVYSMGSSVTIDYTDGPTAKKVDAVVDKFDGVCFDSMIDLKSYKGAFEYEGEMVQSTAWVKVNRHASNETFKAICLAIAEKYGTPEPGFAGGVGNEGIHVLFNQYDERYTSNSIHTEFHREFSKWDEQDGPVNSSEDLPSIKEYERDFQSYQESKEVDKVEDDYIVNRYSNEPVNSDCLTESQDDIFEAAEMLPLYSFDQPIKQSVSKDDWKVW